MDIERYIMDKEVLYGIHNAETGLEILALYTSDLDDYYPCCRMEYNPENLKSNGDKNYE